MKSVAPAIGAKPAVLGSRGMDPKVALTVAIIAAVASFVGALFAWASARAARLSADGIDRRRHMIESLDAETESFRECIAAVYQAMHDIELKNNDYGELRTSTRVNLLRTHPLCTPELGEYGSNGVFALHQIATKKLRGEGAAEDFMKPNWAAFRTEARRIFDDQAAKRRGLVEDVQRARRLEVSKFLPFPFGALTLMSKTGRSKNAQSVDD